MTLGSAKCCSRDGKSKRIQSQRKIAGNQSPRNCFLTIKPSIWRISVMLHIMGMLGSANNIPKDANMNLEVRVLEQKKAI